jgi:tetratricopeptide (TPR) repeat protein
MKQIVGTLIFLSICFSNAYSQKSKGLYKLYNNREFVKCVQKCDIATTKYPNFYEAYYVKSIAYFEMSQLPEKYTDFTKDPLMDCLKTLSILRGKDPDGVTFDEHADTLQMIYKYCEAKAQSLRTTNKDKAILMYQRLMHAYKVQTNALELAIIYAKVGDYEKCMSQVSRLYEKSKPEVNSSSEDYDALTKGAILLANNWMFRDLFWIIETYKPKFETNYAIAEGFKKALIITIDTARGDDDKTYFQDFSKEGVRLYPADQEIKAHIEMRWMQLVDQTVEKYKATNPNNRTWRDSVILRDAYKYLEMAKEILPESTVFNEKQKKLNAEFHTVPFSFEQAIFQKYALEAVNRWRTEGCVCDTVHFITVLPVPEL